MLGWGAGGAVGEGASYVEARRGRPDAVAGRADDAGLVEVAGADEACRAELAVRIHMDGEAGLDSFQMACLGFRWRVPVNIFCGKLEISS